MADVDVLVIGAGPVGLTAAAELRRRGVDCRIVDRLAERLPFAKAVGIQPRTLEIWQSMGLVREVLDAAAPLYGQLVYVNGEQVARITLELPPDVPYGFAVLPQYETERLLTDHLERWDTHIERGTELTSFEQDADEVRARLTDAAGRQRTVSAHYLIGCDGAHSAVRHGLGLGFEGDAFPEEYMLGDVELDWDMPPGFAVRAAQERDGRPGDLLVCIPLPGRHRYRISTLVPPELSMPPRGAPRGDDVRHGLDAGRSPELRHLQAVLDRMAPRPATASRLRWGSLFRISHRLVDRYAQGRVFVAGDAAHIHPPTGAQGMNTGIQDAYNLAWKLALVVRGAAGPGLLDSYQAERRPVGEEVVGRTVRHARAGFGADPDDPATVVQREAQLLVGYPDSPIVGGDGVSPARPAAGERAPDCGPLVRAIATFPVRLFDLLGVDHTLLLYADAEETADGVGSDAAAAEGPLGWLVACAERAREEARGLLRVRAILAPGVLPDGGGDLPPVIHDGAGAFRQRYQASDGEGFLIRPDGYLGLRFDAKDPGRLSAHLRTVFGGLDGLDG